MPAHNKQMNHEFILDHNLNITGLDPATRQCLKRRMTMENCNTGMRNGPDVTPGAYPQEGSRHPASRAVIPCLF